MKDMIYTKFKLQKVLNLNHWGQVIHICICNLTIIGSDNGLSLGRRQAIIWTNAGMLFEPLGTNFSEIIIKMLSMKWRPFCLGLNELRADEHFLKWPPCALTMQSSMTQYSLKHNDTNRKSAFEITKDIPYITLMDELWVFFCELFEKKKSSML